MSILIGNLVKVQVVFKDEHGNVQDPATVTAYVKNPSSSITDYVYGTDPELKRSSQGKYYIEIDTTAAPGEWQIVWQSTGTYQAAGQTKFTVEATYFTPTP
jgi:hypothetical protein